MGCISPTPVVNDDDGAQSPPKGKHVKAPSTSKPEQASQTSQKSEVSLVSTKTESIVDTKQGSVDSKGSKGESESDYKGQQSVSAGSATTPSLAANHSSIRVKGEHQLKQQLKKQDKLEQAVAKILASKGALERPPELDWFPEGHGHKRAKKVFKWGEEIGHGVTAAVYSCTYKGRNVAVKKIERNNKWGTMLFTTEARVMRNLKHTSIIEFLDVYYDQKYFYLAMERAHYDLYYSIKRSGELSESVASAITCNLLLALDYLHGKNVAHRDLKPENIVFHKSDHTVPKIIDFGDAEYVQDNKKYTEFVGTPPYMSPERLDEHEGWQLKKADVWAVGVIAYEMVVGARCFTGETQDDIFKAVTRAKWSWPQHFKPSKELDDFVKCCLQKDARDRPSCDEALKHPWLTGGKLEKLSTKPKPRPKKLQIQSMSSGSGGSTDSVFDKRGDSSSFLLSSPVLSRFEDLVSLVSSTRLQQLLSRGVTQTLSEQDKKRYLEEFALLDKNKDGFVCDTDLVTEFTNSGMAPSQATSLASMLINELDTDGTGKITEDIFIMSRVQSDLHKNTQHLQQLFRDIRDSANSNNNNSNRLGPDAAQDEEKNNNNNGISGNKSNYNNTNVSTGALSVPGTPQPLTIGTSDDGRSRVSTDYAASSRGGMSEDGDNSRNTPVPTSVQAGMPDIDALGARAGVAGAAGAAGAAGGAGRPGSPGQITLEDVRRFSIMSGAMRFNNNNNGPDSAETSTTGLKGSGFGMDSKEMEPTETGDDVNGGHKKAVTLTELSNMFAEFDTDGDGKLTFDDFLGAMKGKSLRQIVTNQDDSSRERDVEVKLMGGSLTRQSMELSRVNETKEAKIVAGAGGSDLKGVMQLALDVKNGVPVESTEYENGFVTGSTSSAPAMDAVDAK